MAPKIGNLPNREDREGKKKDPPRSTGIGLENTTTCLNQKETSPRSYRETHPQRRSKKNQKNCGSGRKRQEDTKRKKKQLGPLWGKKRNRRQGTDLLGSKKKEKKRTDRKKKNKRLKKKKEGNKST